MKLVDFLKYSLGILLVVASGFAVCAESMGPTLDKIAANGTLYLGHREASVPFSYLAPGRAEPEGFSIEVCAHVVKAIEEKLGRKIVVQPVAVSANSRIMMVKAGMVDIECGVTTHTVARDQLVAFSTTFFISEVKAMVADGSPVKSLKDMSNQRIVTTVGATADRLVKQAAMTRSVALRSFVGSNNQQSMNMLEKGDVDVFVADDGILLGERAQSASPGKYRILDEGYSVEPYGLLLPKGDTQFKNLVDGVLIGLMKSGQMEKIYNAWFMSPIPPGNHNMNFPMSPLNKAAYANPGDRPVN